MDESEVRLSDSQVECIEHWNKLVARLPKRIALPSFPIWGDEIWARYPFQDATPFSCSTEELHTLVGVNGQNGPLTKADLLSFLPSYARSEVDRFPRWKRIFLEKEPRLVNGR